MISPFKGQCAIKKYLHSKPHKWGVKVFTLASSCGIIHDLQKYVGKGTAKSNSKLHIGGDIVIALTDFNLALKYQNKKSHKIILDNWFPLFHLLFELKIKGLLAVGIVRTSKLASCQFIEDKILGKKVGEFTS